MDGRQLCSSTKLPETNRTKHPDGVSVRHEVRQRWPNQHARDDLPSLRRQHEIVQRRDASQDPRQEHLATLHDEELSSWWDASPTGEACTCWRSCRSPIPPANRRRQYDGTARQRYATRDDFLGTERCLVRASKKTNSLMTSQKASSAECDLWASSEWYDVELSARTSAVPRVLPTMVTHTRGVPTVQPSRPTIPLPPADPGTIAQSSRLSVCLWPLAFGTGSLARANEHGIS